MSEDKANPIESEEAASPEVQDYVGEEKPEGNPVEPAKPADDSEKTEDKKTPDAKDEALTEDEKKNPESLNPENQTYEVAGKTYESFEDAEKAIRKIAGHNTQMAGELKKLRQQVDENQAKYDEALKANQEWQEYFEKGGEKPTTDIEAIVSKVVEKREADKTEAQLKSVYSKEIDELPEEKDFTEVYPVFMDMAEKLGDNVKLISPKTLYRMCRGLKNETAETKNAAASELIKQTEEKVKSKADAQKIIGGNNKGTPVQKNEDLSPEVADYLNQF